MLRYVSVWLLVCFTGLFLSQAWCDSFDWRAYSGTGYLGVAGNLPPGNYVPPVQNQGNVDTCWAFAALESLEANYAISCRNPSYMPNLSVQNLVCAGNQGYFLNGDISNIYGGAEDVATNYFLTTGITTVNKIPYNQTNSSPYWPLQAPYTLYKATEMKWTWDLYADPASIKTYLKTYGPIEAEIVAGTDFIDPATGLKYPNGLGNGYHSVLIVGYADSALAGLGGGYYTVENSSGDTWGPTGNGFGYVSYATMQSDNYLTAISGTSYAVTVPVPVPNTFFLLSALVLSVGIKVFFTKRIPVI